MHRVLDVFAFVAILENGGNTFYLIIKKGGVIYSQWFFELGDDSVGKTACFTGLRAWVRLPYSISKPFVILPLLHRDGGLEKEDLLGQWG